MFIDKRITLPEESDNTESFISKLKEALFKYTTNIANAINGGLRLNENIDCKIVEHTFTAGNTEYAISHGLKRVPQGFIIVNRDARGFIMDTGTAWTSENIYLKCVVGGTTAKLLIF